MTQFILINGSLNPSSKTKYSLTIMKQKFAEKGFSAKVINVGELGIPLYIPGVNYNELNPNILQELLNAKAFIIGSPEYHGGYSGALKNFLDYLNKEVFKDKPAGLITLTGGLKSGGSTLNSLCTVLRNLHAIVIPEQIAISEKELMSDKSSVKIEERTDELIKSIINHTLLLDPHLQVYG